MGLYHEMNLDLFRNSSQVHDSIVTFWPGQEVKKLLPATPTHRSGSATAAARAGDLAFFTTKFSLQTQNSIPPPANLKEKKCYIPTLLPTSRKCIRTSCVSPKRSRLYFQNKSATTYQDCTWWCIHEFSRTNILYWQFFAVARNTRRKRRCNKR